MRRRLSRRIHRHFLGVLAVVTVGALAVLGGGWQYMMRRQADRLARHLAQVLAEDAHDPRALSRRALEASETLDIDVAVRDLSGRTIAEDHRTAWHVPHATVPLHDPAGAVVGQVTVSAPRDTRTPGLWRPLLALLLVLVVVGIGARGLAFRIARPLERITDASRRFGAGDLSTRVPLHEHRFRGRRGPPHHHCPRHHDEIHDLAHAWNDMAQRIERLVKGQKELLANVSHELRSPLARIRVAMELIERKGYLEDVERDLGELERLIEDVLATSRLDLAGLPARLETVDVPALLTELATRAGHDPMTRGKSVSVDAPASLEMQGDPTLLKRALWNLVENAGKYGAPPIVMSARDEGDRVVLAVTDQGEGIPEAERERVLEPFYRVDKARTPAGPGQPPPGFGLGLTFAKKVAEVHGGTVALGPAEAKGWRVSLTIPRATAAA
jgi:signal transduction histidine kinase